MALSTLPEGLAIAMWARVCVVTVVRVAQHTDYVLQLQTGALGSMITGPLSGDVPARMLVGRTLHASPLPTVRLHSLMSLYP